MAIPEIDQSIREDFMQHLRTADQSCGRPPVEGAYALYQQYIGNGRSTHPDEVVEWIKDEYHLPDDLLPQLRHEIYLASDQAWAYTLAQRAKQMGSEGYRRAAKENLVVGKRYLLAYRSHGFLGIDISYDEQVKCAVGANGDYILMPVRNRKWGYAVNGQWIKEIND